MLIPSLSAPYNCCDIITIIIKLYPYSIKEEGQRRDTGQAFVKPGLDRKLYNPLAEHKRPLTKRIDLK